MKEVVKLNPEIIKKANLWLSDEYDSETRDQVQKLMDNDPKELEESFYADLEFGTGGMRGIMGVGTNRINRYTIGMATQGLANYLKINYGDKPLKAAIAHDCRNNSRLFAQTAADVLSANGVEVYLFEDLRPTPELSFAIRQLGCQTGIVVTASHNPKEYNGYKVYWEDGAQIIAPHDKGIIDEVRKIKHVSDVKFVGVPSNIHSLGNKMDQEYLAQVKAHSLSPQAILNQHDLKIVYTALHGTGIVLIPTALRNLGFDNLTIVPEQDIPDGNFPTVESPNPEEKSALQRGLDLAGKIDADILFGTDPDADRVGLAVKNEKGDFVLINGNQACVLIIWYHLLKWKEMDKLNGNQFIAKTIVTTELIDRITDKYNVDLYTTLTGFKYIASVIRDLEGKKEFITGGEESFGYMVGDFVRDKDAVVSASMFCEIAAWAKDQDSSILELLHGIYREYGFFKEALISLVKKGKAGKEEIAAIMDGYRANPPKAFAGSEVVKIVDVLKGVSVNLKTGDEQQLDLPTSNVMQFYTDNGAKITARPSGTEPKIKFYISVNTEVGERPIHLVEKELDELIDKIKADLNV